MILVFLQGSLTPTGALPLLWEGQAGRMYHVSDAWKGHKRGAPLHHRKSRLLPLVPQEAHPFYAPLMGNLMTRHTPPYPAHYVQLTCSHFTTCTYNVDNFLVVCASLWWDRKDRIIWQSWHLKERAIPYHVHFQSWPFGDACQVCCWTMFGWGIGQVSGST